MATVVASGTQQASRAPRDASIDVLKGIAMIVIMAGHIDPTSVGSPLIGYFYSFNVAAFFLVTGYVWRPRPGTSYVAFAWQKVKQIGIPYVVLFAVSVVYGYLIAPGIPYVLSAPFSITKVAKAFFLGGQWLWDVPLHNFALWFLPLFLIATLLFQLLQYVRGSWVWAVIVVGLIAVSIPFQALVPGRPVLSINVLPVAVALMACGYLLRGLKIVDRLGALATTALFVLTLVVAAYSYGNVSDVRTYTFFPAAIAAFLVLLRVSRDLRSSSLLQFVGRNSLLFFGLHSLVASTYGLTGLVETTNPQFGGAIGYLINLAYVFLLTYALVWLWRVSRARVERWWRERRMRKQSGGAVARQADAEPARSREPVTTRTEDAHPGGGSPRRG